MPRRLHHGVGCALGEPGPGAGEAGGAQRSVSSSRTSCPPAAQKRFLGSLVIANYVTVWHRRRITT